MNYVTFVRCLSPFVLLFLTGCVGGGQAVATKYQHEMTVQKIRADVEELKHDLHTHKMELNILSGKLLNHEDVINTLKKETHEVAHNRVDKSLQQLVNLEQRMRQSETKSEELQNNIKQFLTHMHDATKALTQYKDKINELERHITSQNHSLKDIMHIRKQLSLLIEGTGQRLYRVEPGDTLDVIAKRFDTSVESIRKLNSLEGDRILAGQDLVIPSSHDSHK